MPRTKGCPTSGEFLCPGQWAVLRPGALMPEPEWSNEDAMRRVAALVRTAAERLTLTAGELIQAANVLRQAASKSNSEGSPEQHAYTPPCGESHGISPHRLQNQDYKYYLFHAAGEGCAQCVQSLLELRVSPSSVSDSCNYTAISFAEWGATKEGGNHNTAEVLRILKEAVDAEAEASGKKPGTSGFQ